MKVPQFSRLLAFLERLDRAQISYSMRHSRDDALMIIAFAPSEYWEIEFLEDGDIEIERYRSNGHIEDESILEELFALWSDEDISTAQPMSQDDAAARK